MQHSKPANSNGDNLEGDEAQQPVAQGLPECPRERQPAEKYPICVDLDGTLVNCDTLLEGLLAILSSNGWLVHLPSLVTTDPAVLKRRVAELAKPTPELLPYNRQLIAYLSDCKQAGHPLVLATAADARIAHAIADHLQLFDEVICSDGKINLKGEAKATALVTRFGNKGFDYVGNDLSDLRVWSAAAGIITANASRKVQQAARRLGPVKAEFNDRAPLGLSALRAMRPHQWSKNLLVFVPMVTAHALTELSSWTAAIILFLGFCATASAIYVINDLFDLTADRRHPGKRYRPLASGAISIPFAVGLAVFLLAVGCGLSVLSDAFLLVLVYALVSLFYSLVLKGFPLVDVFVLAGLYTLRVIGGGIATQHHATLWLLAFSGFTFLSLAIVKRSAELQAIECSLGAQSVARRGYQPGDRILLQMFGCASAFASSVVLALFVASESALRPYRAPEVLWLVVPLILFWQCRLWLMTVRGSMHEDPILFALRDWVSWLVAATALVVMLTASSGIVSFN